MIKILGFKIVSSVWSDASCSDVVSFNVACGWCVDAVVNRLELAGGDVRTVCTTGWNYL